MKTLRYRNHYSSHASQQTKITPYEQETRASSSRASNAANETQRKRATPPTPKTRTENSKTNSKEHMPRRRHHSATNRMETELERMYAKDDPLKRESATNTDNTEHSDSDADAWKARTERECWQHTATRTARLLRIR